MLEYEISASDAASLVREGQARIVDVREPWELATASIEGTLAMPMGEVPARATRNSTPKSA
jgi:rhodanese-related sulfurtransferase